MASTTVEGCGCPPTAPAVPSVNGVHHEFLAVKDISRSRAFYGSLMPRLGYPEICEYEGTTTVGWNGAGGSFWIKQADAQYRDDTFSKGRAGLSEVALRAESRQQVDALARDVRVWGGTILDPPCEYPQYVPGYYAVFFADPDGIKLELVHIPG